MINPVAKILVLGLLATPPMLPVCLLGAPPESAPTPAAPVIPASAMPVQPARPAAPQQPTIAPPGVQLLVAGFARTPDLMRDVRASVAPIARAPSSVRSIAVEPTVEPKRLRFEPFQPATKRIDVIGTSSKQDSRTTALGSFEVVGSTVNWRWNRVNIDMFEEALRECDVVLPAVVVAVLLDDGGASYAAGPASIHRVSLQRMIPGTIDLFKVPGRSLALHVSESEDWSRKADGGDTILECARGTLRLSLDDSTGVLTLLLQDPVSAELAAARRELDARREEMARKKGGQREIVAGEITELEQRVRDLQAEAAASKTLLPKFPRIVGVDHAGRVFAEIKVTAK